MDNNPIVSIIIPVYNRVDCLKRAVDSVINQIYKNWELIIVDDGSDEDIASYVISLKQETTRPVILIRQENQGPGIARKNGLARATGSYVQYLDSDDELLPEKLKKQVALMERVPEAVMCYCPTIMKSDRGQGLRKFSDEYEPDLLKGALEWRRWHTSSCLWRYPDKSIAYWSHYYHGEDVLHDVSVGVNSRFVTYLPEVLCIAYSDSKENLSNYPKSDEKQARYNESIYKVKVECYKLLKEHNLLKKRKYIDPLSERFFHSGLILLKNKDIKRGVWSLIYSIKISKYYLRTILAIVAIITSWFSLLGFGVYYRWFFLFYQH